MIRDSRLWNLYLAIDAHRIDVMAYCPLEDHSLFTATIELDKSSSTSIEAIEEAVYDNPLLLNEFNSVTIISRSNHRTLIPTSIAEDHQMANDIVTEMTGADNQTLIVDPLPLLDMSMCHMMESAIFNFLTRTFNAAKFIHRLSALIRYFHGTNRSSSTLNTHVNIMDEKLDIILHHGDKLLLANSYHWQEQADILYYILASRKSCSIDSKSPVVISGQRELRDNIMPLLRQYIPTVVPAIFPASMFQAGGNDALNAPTDLIVLPLCE